MKNDIAVKVMPSYEIRCEQLNFILMERRVRGNPHARCEAGEKMAIISKFYLLLLFTVSRLQR